MKKIITILALLVVGNYLASAQVEEKIQEIGNDPFYSLFKHFNTFKTHLVFYANYDSYPNFCIIKDGSDQIERLMEVQGNIYIDQLSSLEFGNELFFTARTSTGLELYVTDGTPLGCRLVEDITPGSGSSNPYNLTEYNGKLYFLTWSKDDSSKNGLWVSDGTSQGTQQIYVSDSLKFLSIDNDYSKPMTIYDDKLYFYTIQRKVMKLWQSDGTAAGTRVIKEFEYAKMSTNTSINASAIYKNKLYFTSCIKQAGPYGNIWETDGTEAGTVLVKGEGGYGGFAGLMPFDGKLYSLHRDSTNTQGSLWQCDGTAAGTWKVKDIPNLRPSINKYRYVVHQKKLYFASDALDASSLAGLWVTDGTKEGTQDIRKINIKLTDTPDYSAIYQLKSVRNKLFFFSNNFQGGALWMTDGTNAGTECISPKPSNQTVSQSEESIIYNNTLYYTMFYDKQSPEERQLFKLHFDSDGIGNATSQNFDYSIYPNPSRGRFKISLPFLQSGHLRVFDQLGALKKTVSYRNNRDIDLDLTELSDGIYSVEILTDSGSKGVKKIVLER